MRQEKSHPKEEAWSMNIKRRSSSLLPYGNRAGLNIAGGNLIFLAVSAIFILIFPPLVQADEILAGAGATFPSPLYEKWIKAYHEKTGTRISYKGVGSGEGVQSLLKREVDFAGTDIFLSDEQLGKEKASILHIPTCMGAVGIIYNLPGNPELRLNSDILTNIFLGRITNWSAKEIAEVNPGKTLPNLSITVVHRSDGSGTNYVLTDYFSKVNPRWSNEVGSGTKVKWKTGIGVEKNSGVADTVKKIQGSIGYVSLDYAEEKGLPVASIRNSSGNYVKPTAEAIMASADVDIPQDIRILITNTASPKGYPISTFTYIILYKEQAYQNRTREKAAELARFLQWCIHDGQGFTRPLFYAPLPVSAIQKADAIIRSIVYNGEPVLKK
jgi:phosphate transport system substrate-binding protein